MKLNKKKIKSLSAKKEIGNALTPNVAGAKGSGGDVDHTNGRVCNHLTYAQPCNPDVVIKI